MYINGILFCFLGGVNGICDYLWQINFSSMEKSKNMFQTRNASYVMY